MSPQTLIRGGNSFSTADERRFPTENCERRTDPCFFARRHRPFDELRASSERSRRINADGPSPAFGRNQEFLAPSTPRAQRKGKPRARQESLHPWRSLRLCARRNPFWFSRFAPHRLNYPEILFSCCGLATQIRQVRAKHCHSRGGGKRQSDCERRTDPCFLVRRHRPFDELRASSERSRRINADGRSPAFGRYQTVF